MNDIDIISLDAIERPALSWDTVFDAEKGFGDWVLAGKDATNPGGLMARSSIATAVVLSLFTDRRAPEGWRPEIQDRRGWWGDGIQPEGEPLDPQGSWLWLLENERMSPRVVADAKRYAEMALAWMTEGDAPGSNRDTHVAAKVTVVSEARADNRGINLGIEIFAKSGARIYAQRFDILWQQVG